MTKMLEKAFERASGLSEQEQDAIADWLLKELEAEKQWSVLFDGSQDALSTLAEEALEEHRLGRTEDLDLGHNQ